ncbi:MAG: glycosyltransferase [archaeon]
MQGEKVLFISSFPPRECGIATFTKDLTESIQKKFGNSLKPKIVAMNESESSFHKYPGKVVSSIVEQDFSDYERIAKKINSMRDVKVVNIQHEFGLFGGEYGGHLLRLMELSDKKIVTTLHTVLENPDQKMLETIQGIFAKSEKVIVMTEIAKKILSEQYGVPKEKIRVIPHGVPSISYGKDKEKLKRKFGLEGKNVLLTFGLLSRGKAIEHVINAMPEIVRKNPNALYLIVGETHPKVREQEGESYRAELKELIRKNMVEDNVKFMDKFVTTQELVECLTISDLYLAPSLDPKQICSGTVSYALGAGKAIVASKNKYNEEMLSNGRGIMLPANSPKGFADAANRLLNDEALLKGYEKNAFEFSRKMTWPNVSAHYTDVFYSISENGGGFFGRLPKVSFRHFSRLTDDFGIIQFADYSTPDKQSGYTLDDNARALTVAVKGYEKFGTQKMLRFADKFLGFIDYCKTENGKFHNELNYEREFMDDFGSEDSFGRAIRALGSTWNSSLPDKYRFRAREILESTMKNGQEINSPRAQANTLIGLANSSALSANDGTIRAGLVDSLVSKFHENSDDEWQWFEKYLTYGNSVIPESLFEAAPQNGLETAMEVAKKSLNFLTKTLFINNKFVPIGQEAWYLKGEERSVYDQQPIEAGTTTTAYLKAFEKTGDESYRKKAREAFDWFLGQNSANQVVYDEATGGCFDGITRTGVNANEGAESTISYLLARLSIS